MINLTLKTVKKLYNAYSPFKTNLQLTNDFINIIEEDIDVSPQNIREKYNKYVTRYFINETVIKSAFLKQYSFNKSSKNTVTIFEMKAGSSRADICMINGKSIVFEIKTDYDNFTRLNKQIKDYLNLFEYIYLIIPENKIQLAESFIDTKIGIIYYKQNRLGNIKFYKYKDSHYNYNLNPFKQLSILSKSELYKFTSNKDKSKENLIHEIINSYNKAQINQLFKDYYKKKYSNQWKYIHKRQKEIYPLDYQWFFKYNISTSTVYK